GDAGEEALHHPGELLFHQRGDDVVAVGEVLVEGGPADPHGGSDLAEGDVGRAELLDQLLGGLEDLAPGELLVLGDRLGADAGHVPRVQPIPVRDRSGLSWTSGAPGCRDGTAGWAVPPRGRPTHPA